MEPEQSQNFNERLSQWVANQGFWFQLRYSLAGSGSTGTVAFHLIRMGFRLLVFLLLAGVVGWIYLMKRVESEKYSDTLNASIRSGFSASESQVKGISHSQGKLNIGGLSLQGGSGTFYSSLEAKSVRMDMGLFDGIVRDWNTGTITVARLDMDLRAGADDAEASKMLADSIFKISNDIIVNNIEIMDASIHWGYSERTKGSILNSSLKVQRLEGGKMILTFQGGTFSQNWLRKMDIVNLVITCNRDGFVFDKGELRKEQGSVDLAGITVTGGDRPTVQGVAKLKSLDIDAVLPTAFKTFLEGSISGDVQVSGSTNTADGIVFAGKVELGGRDTIILRKRLHLLQALSDVDYVRNYHRVDFSEGTFGFKTGRGGLEITDVDLKAGDLLTLQGKMKVRLPTPEETAAALNHMPEPNDPSRFIDPNGGQKELSAEAPKEADFTLRRAAAESKKDKDGAPQAPSGSLLNRMNADGDMQRLEELATESLSRTLRYEGLFQITLQSDAFERAPKLIQQYPVDPATNRIPITVPIEGNLYEVTLKQAEEIYQGRTR